MKRAVTEYCCYVILSSRSSRSGSSCCRTTPVKLFTQQQQQHQLKAQAFTARKSAAKLSDPNNYISPRKYLNKKKVLPTKSTLSPRVLFTNFASHYYYWPAVTRQWFKNTRTRPPLREPVKAADEAAGMYSCAPAMKQRRGGGGGNVLLEVCCSSFVAKGCCLVFYSYFFQLTAVADDERTVVQVQAAVVLQNNIAKQNYHILNFFAGRCLLDVLIKFETD